MSRVRHRPPTQRLLLSANIVAPYASDLQTSDLLPGVYEGGFKLWECAVDLAAFVAAELPAEAVAPGQRVLELGCGHGLPGVVALLRGAHVDFIDYNIEVRCPSPPPSLAHTHTRACARICVGTSGTRLPVPERLACAQVIQQLTIPNVFQNLAVEPGNQQLGGRARFFGGDWNRLAEVAPAEGYDLILTADTLYTTQCADELASLIGRHLKRAGGIGCVMHPTPRTHTHAHTHTVTAVVWNALTSCMLTSWRMACSLVAAKRYYFGVGGGTDAFVAALAKQTGDGAGWATKEALTLADGKSNARLIVQVLRQVDS